MFPSTYDIADKLGLLKCQTKQHHKNKAKPVTNSAHAGL